MLVSDQVDPVLLLVSVGEAMNNFGSVILLENINSKYKSLGVHGKSNHVDVFFL